MKKDQLAFLVAGVLFGALLGYGLFHAFANRPAAQAAAAGGAQPIPSPAGPMAPGSGMGAPPAAGTAGMAGGAALSARIDQLKKALELDPGNLNAVTGLANAYHDAGMWQQAADWYDKALAISPDDPNLLTDQGICYRGLRQYDRALERFRRARQVDPKHWPSLYNVAVVAGIDLGRHDEALAALAEVEKEAPPDAHPSIHDLQHALEQSKAAAAGGGR